MTRDERLDRLEKRHDRLIDTFLDLRKMQELLAEQLAEQNLRLRCVMEFMKVKKTQSAVLDGGGKPVVEMMSFYEFYWLKARADMLEALRLETQAQMQQAEEAMHGAPHESEAVQPAEAPASGEGSADGAPDAEPPLRVARPLVTIN